MREQNIINRLGNKTTDIKYFKHLLPNTPDNIIEPFGGSFAVIRNCYDYPEYNKFVNDNDEALYSIYTNPEAYKNLCIEANNLCLANLNENGFCIYTNVIEQINNMPYNRDLIEYWKMCKIIRGTCIKLVKNINFDKSIQQLSNINFSCVDWFNYTYDHAKNENTFIFLDPPYLFSDNSQYSQCKRRENCDVTDIIYKILEIFKNPLTKAKMMLVINDMKIIRWLFNGYIVGGYEKIYQLGKRKDKHLIICNYNEEDI